MYRNRRSLREDSTSERINLYGREDEEVNYILKIDGAEYGYFEEYADAVNAADEAIRNYEEDVEVIDVETGDVVYSGDEEDLDESRRPRGRMLREGRRPMRRRMTENAAVINPRIANKFMSKIQDLAKEMSKFAKYGSEEDNWNLNVVSRAIKSLNAAYDHLEDVE